MKDGDRVEVYSKTNAGDSFFGTVRAVSESRGVAVYFIQRHGDGSVFIYKEAECKFRKLSDDEKFPEPKGRANHSLSCCLPKYEPRKQPLPEVPSFTKGQHIKSSEELWEVTNIYPETDELEIMPLAMSGHMSSYLQMGQKYRLVKHNAPEMGKGGIWEIPGEIMDRDSSQVLLYLWEDTGPSIEIDF